MRIPHILFHRFARTFRVNVDPVALLTGVSVIVIGSLLFQYVRQNGQHDFMPFYFGGKVAASGQIANIYDKATYQPLIEDLRHRGERMSPFDANYFIRPAFQAFFYIPFSWLPYDQASLLALTANIGLLGFLVWQLPRWFATYRAIRPAVRMALALFFPFIMSIALGQDTLLLTLLVAYAFFLENEGSSALAGIVLGLCAWKPHLIGLLPLALIAARRWRMAVFFLATSGFLLGLSYAMVGRRGFRQWIQLVQDPSSDIHTPWMGNIRALSIHYGIVFAVCAMALTIICFYIVLRHGVLTEKLSAAIFVALLASPHTYWQDYSLTAIIGLLAVSPAVSLMLLIPWPYFYGSGDELPMIFISVACLIALCTRAAGLKVPPICRPLFRSGGVSRTEAAAASSRTPPGA